MAESNLFNKEESRHGIFQTSLRIHRSTVWQFYLAGSRSCNFRRPTHIEQSVLRTMEKHFHTVFQLKVSIMTVLQLILEHITDKAFLDLITVLVFDPLGMGRWFNAISQEDNYAIAHHIGYAACKIPFRENPEQAVAVLWNTPTDLLKPVHALHRSLKLSDQTGLLHKKVVQELLTDVSRTVSMGWFAPREPGNSFGYGGSNESGWQRFLIGYTNLEKYGDIFSLSKSFVL